MVVGIFLGAIVCYTAILQGQKMARNPRLPTTKTSVGFFNEEMDEFNQPTKRWTTRFLNHRAGSKWFFFNDEVTEMIRKLNEKTRLYIKLQICAVLFCHC